MEDKLLSQLSSCSASTVTVRNVASLSAYPVCLLQSSYVASVTALLCSLQQLPSNVGECMSINMSTFCVSFGTMAVKLHLTLVFVTPLQINPMSKILQHPFSVWSNSPAAV
jgi:hypothetical protein